MKTVTLFEDLTTKVQGIVNGYLFSRRAKIEATAISDAAKNVLIDNVGGDAKIILSPDSYLDITTACKDTIDWRTAFVNLASHFAATDAEQKKATRGCTNTVTATAVRVFEAKSPKKRREVK